MTPASAWSSFDRIPDANLDDFYTSDARFTVGDLAEVGDRAAEDFRLRHPEIAEEAVQA